MTSKLMSAALVREYRKSCEEGDHFSYKAMTKALDLAEYYRARCPALAEDLEGLTGDKIAAWILATGDWSEIESARPRVRIFHLAGSLEQIMIGMGAPEDWADSPRAGSNGAWSLLVGIMGTTRVYLDIIRREAKRTGRPELDILDAMVST